MKTTCSYVYVMAVYEQPVGLGGKRLLFIAERAPSGHRTAGSTRT